MKISDMIPMMKEFFSSAFKYRKEIKKHDKWIDKYISQKGFSKNPHWMFYTNLKIWLVESEQLFGKRICPCFEPSGDSELNRKLLCPCSFAEEEIKTRGTCHCVLFGKGDLSEDEYKKAEAHLMEEYRRIPLKLEGNILDTRGMIKDKMRNLPVPDALHQTKRALGMLQAEELLVYVETEAETENLKKLAASRMMNSSIEKDSKMYKVKLYKK